VISGTRLILPCPIIWSNNIVYLKKSEHLESNVLEHHPIETKASGRHPVECLQNILTNAFERSLSKLDCTFKKMRANNLTITYPNPNVKIPTVLIEHLSILEFIGDQ